MKQTATQRLLKFSKGSWINYLASIILAMIGTIGNLVPYFAVSRMIVGFIRKEECRQYLLYSAIGYVIGIVGALASTSISHIATFKMITSIRLALTDKLASIPLGFLLTVPSGMFKDSIVEKVDQIEPIMAHVVPEMTSNLFSPLVMILYFFYLDWRMSIISLICVPISFLAFMGMMKDYDTKFRAFVHAGKECNATVVEYINGIEVIKAFNQSTKSYEKFIQSVSNKAKFAIQWMKDTQFYFVIGLGLSPSVLLTVLPFGCVFYINGYISLEKFIDFILISQGIIPPLIQAMSYTDYIAKIGAIIDDFGVILDQEDIQRPTKFVSINSTNIELKNVSFSYQKDEILRNINLNIPQGKVTALVGPSGSGKSTIAKLIASLWEVKTGSIKIDGIDLQDIPLNQASQMISYVSQDCYLYNDTIRNNIRMAKLDSTDDEIESIIFESGCSEFVKTLENGIDTYVGDGGCHLSGGERQRISLARAMMKKAQIIILDEATAYIDPENEAIIQKAISKLIHEKTLIVIAHRLSTIVNSDNIVVVEKGAIIAQGSHEELLEKCPLYKRMWIAHLGSRDLIIDS